MIPLAFSVAKLHHEIAGGIVQVISPAFFLFTKQLHESADEIT